MTFKNRIIKNKRKIYGIIAAVITLLIPFFLILLGQNSHLETDQSFCPFKMLTGFPCPGCGITKSLVYFYKGDLYKSMFYHVLGPFVVLFAMLTIILLTIEIVTKKEYLNKYFYNRKIAIFLGIFLATYQLIRVVYFIKTHSIEEIYKESIWG
ncbi:MAG: DUF2752 domain-containing protein [Flavobacterium sp.]|nr:DUF2752 domain-containing protein [Flavobacterium sp.]